MWDGVRRGRGFQCAHVSVRIEGHTEQSFSCQAAFTVHSPIASEVC